MALGRPTSLVELSVRGDSEEASCCVASVFMCSLPYVQGGHGTIREVGVKEEKPVGAVSLSLLRTVSGFSHPALP